MYAEPSGQRMGVYCVKCNSWICWTSYKKMIQLYKQIDEDELNDSIALRRIFKRNGITRMNCSKCDCLLYSSFNPKITGQFDLVNANYCPNCGRKLI